MLPWPVSEQFLHLQIGRQMNEMVQEFYQFQSPVQTTMLLLIICKRNSLAPPSHSSLVFLTFTAGNGKFLISAGISAFARSSWGPQLLLMIGVHSLEWSSIWLRTEPLHKQADFRQALLRHVESLGEIIFVWSSSYGTP